MRKNFIIGNKVKDWSLKGNIPLKLLISIMLIFVVYLLFFNIFTSKNIKKYLSPEKDVNKLKNVNAQNQKVTPQTNFIFRSIYVEDQNLVEEKKRPSAYDINLTQKELSERYKEWEIKNFDSLEVIFERKITSKSPDYYVIKELDGYMAVFYENPSTGLRLREITEKRLDTLEELEQDKIKKGIVVHGEEELIRLLEDYS